jgi:hypothetical protein
MTVHPGPDTPEATDQQDDTSQGSGASARRDRITNDQRAGSDRRCGREAHAAQRTALIVKDYFLGHGISYRDSAVAPPRKLSSTFTGQPPFVHLFGTVT